MGLSNGMNIKKGDNVKIMAGKDRGKTGKVLKMLSHESRIMVEGINVYKKHVRPKKEGEKGEIVDITRPLQIANTMLVCPSCNKPTRIGHTIKDEEKVRTCKKCKTTI